MFRSEMLKFNASPRGFYYGGPEHFQESVIETVRQLYTQGRLKYGEEMGDNMPTLPIMVNILFDDNTALSTTVFPMDPQQIIAVANSIRSFMSQTDYVEILNTNSKPVCIIITTESRFTAVKSEGLTDDEVRAKLNDPGNEKQIGIIFNIQHKDPSKDRYVNYQAWPDGRTELRSDVEVIDLKKDKNASMPYIWSDMFTRPPEGDVSHYYNPKDAEKIVSALLKKIIASNKATKEVQPYTEEELAKFKPEKGPDLSDLLNPEKQ